MNWKIPEVPDDFDRDLRDGSIGELAKTEQDNLILLFEEVLSDLLRYFTVGFIAEQEYKDQASSKETEFEGIADSHPFAEAGLRLQDQCEEIYNSLRGVESMVAKTESVDPMEFYKMLQENKEEQSLADTSLIQAHNDLLQAWSAFDALLGEQAERWLAEADARIESIT